MDLHLVHEHRRVDLFSETHPSEIRFRVKAEPKSNAQVIADWLAVYPQSLVVSDAANGKQETSDLN